MKLSQYRTLRLRRWHVVMVAAVGAMVVQAIAIAQAQAPAAAPAKAINPHWRQDACDACHPMKDGKAQTIGFAESERICLSCHDGVRAEAEAHPVDRLLAGERFLDPGWPLLEGKIVCQTCHDISLTLAHGNAQSVQSDWLRPPVGQGPDAFCASCHKPVQFSRVNPHRMMTPEGQPVPADCLLCHTRPPDPRTMVRAGQWDLRADVMTLCRSCHFFHVDWFEPGHMGATVPPKILAHMRAKEIVGLTSRPSREMVARLQTENARPQKWALGAGDTLICTSCHNPHQKGVFPEGSELGDDAMEIEGDRVTSKILVPQMCLRCHNL